MADGAHHWWDWLRHHHVQDSKGMWMNSFLRMMGYSLMGMFASVFVFSFGRENFLGGDIRGGLLLLLVFMLGVRLTTSLTGIFMAKYVIAPFGYRKSILLSVVLGVTGFALLALASSGGRIEFIYIASALFGLVIPIYFITYFTLLTEGADTQHVGHSFGVLDAMSRLGQAVAPFIGALVAAWLGFAVLFYFGIVFLILSALPVFFLPRHQHWDEVSWREFFEWASEPKFVRAGMAMGGQAINFVTFADLWPVYVFLMLGSLQKLGIFKSLVMFATAVFVYLVSWLFDKRPYRSFQVVGVLGGVVAWVLRGFVGGMWQVVALDSVDGFFFAAHNTFFSGYLLKRARGKQMFSFMVYRTMWRSLWLVALYILLIGVLLVWGSDWFWPVAFAAAATGLGMTLLIRDKK